MKLIAAATALLLVSGSVVHAVVSRLAIVDVGAEAAPQPFIDFLTVALTKEPSVALVE